MLFVSFAVQNDLSAGMRAATAWISQLFSMLKQFSKTLAAHRSRIRANFDFDGLSIGPLEGTNNKIKTLRKIAYDFRIIEFFKLKIMALHETMLCSYRLNHKVRICRNKHHLDGTRHPMASAHGY